MLAATSASGVSLAATDTSGPRSGQPLQVHQHSVTDLEQMRRMHEQILRDPQLREPHDSMAANPQMRRNHTSMMRDPAMRQMHDRMMGGSDGMGSMPRDMGR